MCLHEARELAALPVVSGYTRNSRKQAVLFCQFSYHVQITQFSANGLTVCLVATGVSVIESKAERFADLHDNFGALFLHDRQNFALVGRRFFKLADVLFPHHRSPAIRAAMAFTASNVSSSACRETFTMQPSMSACSWLQARFSTAGVIELRRVRIASTPTAGASGLVVGWVRDRKNGSSFSSGIVPV